MPAHPDRSPRDDHLLAEIAADVSATDPELARSLAELRPPDTTPTAVAIVLSMMLMLLDAELFALGLRDHPVWLFIAILSFPGVLTPITHSMKHQRL